MNIQQSPPGLRLEKWLRIDPLLQFAGISMGISREELYEQVWAETMLKVAERYNVSSSYMARVCTILKVPRPPVGYWAKEAVNRAPPKPPLPVARPGDQVEWTPGAALYRPLPEHVPRTPKRPASLRTPRVQAGQANPSTAASSPHAILAGVKGILEGAKEADDYLKPTKRFMVDILVSKALANAAVETAEALFQAFESRSHSVRFAQSTMQFSRLDFDEREVPPGVYPSWPSRWRPDRATVVHIGSVAIGLTLGEMTEALEGAYVKNKFVPMSDVADLRGGARIAASSWISKKDVPSGRLRLRAYSPYHDTVWSQSWDEKSPGDLKKRLPEIMKQLERSTEQIAVLVEEARVRAEKQERQWQEQQRQWDRQAQERRRAERRERSLKDLGDVFAEWERQHRLDGFFREMTARAAELSEADRLALGVKIDRARQLLGQTDVFDRFTSWQPPED